MAGREKKLSSVIESGVWSVLTELYYIMPGHVVEYPTDDRRASIQPSIKTEDEQGDVKSRAQIQNVPVIFLTGGKHTATVGLNEGDEGILFFSQRSLDRWLDHGSEVDPKDARMHNISDGLFLPCSLSNPAVQSAFDDAAFVGMRDQSAGLKVNGDGSLEFFRDDTDLLIAIRNKASEAASAASDLDASDVGTASGTTDTASGHTHGYSTTVSWSSSASNALSDLQSSMNELSNLVDTLVS